MTHLSAAVPSLPLSVSCAADSRFAATLTALARRVATATGGDAGADRFTSAITEGVAACMAHLGADRSRLLTVELTAGSTEVQGSLRWTRLSADDDMFAARLETSLGGKADRVECGHRDDDAFCCVTCQRG